MAKKTLKARIIDLSKMYSIVTKFTSFVAIEKREKVRKYFTSRCIKFKHSISTFIQYSIDYKLILLEKIGKNKDIIVIHR